MGGGSGVDSEVTLAIHRHLPRKADKTQVDALDLCPSVAFEYRGLPGHIPLIAQALARSEGGLARLFVVGVDRGPGGGRSDDQQQQTQHQR